MYTFSKSLEQWIADNGLKQNEAAEILNCEKSHITRILNYTNSHNYRIIPGYKVKSTKRGVATRPYLYLVRIEREIPMSPIFIKKWPEVYKKLMNSLKRFRND